MSQAVAQPELQGAAPRILVVDDEQYMCDVCTRTLARGGYYVVATSDPDEAVAWLRGGGFDLLLTDIKMPTMSGLDLARIARESDPAIAIIIMTGFASIEHLHQAVRRGVADFLSKPFELEHLRLAVDQALHKRSLLQDNLRLHALAQLLASSEQLSTTLELAELAGILLRVTLAQSGCRAGFLLLAENEYPSTEQASLAGPGRELARQTLADPQAHPAVGETFATLGEADLPYALAVPLRAQGEVQGVLVLCDDREQTLRPGVQESVMLLANHAGAALRNAYLYSQLEVAYQRLQELDRLKGEFIAIASHELRTPLSIVLGYGMMVRDQSNGDHREYMQRIMEGAQRIKEVVDDMVSLRHLEIGESQPNLEPIVVQELISQSIDAMNALVASTQHEIIADLPNGDLVLQSDREKLLLIVNHLLSNAIKFSPPSSRIVISAMIQNQGEILQNGAHLIPHAPEPETCWAVLTFQDQGIGIPEREQRRIFDRFYQVADSLRRERGGIGLGLALVRELVSTLGGIVWVNSREGEGSVFAVALPFIQEQAAA
jgi:signal transduction histidine kinase